MRTALVIVVAVLAGCSTASGDDEPGTTKPSPDAASDGATVDTSNIFAVEDTADPGDSTSSPDDVSTEDTVDSAPMTTTVTLDTLECRVIRCPFTHPYVVGCNLTLGGLSSIGCAANVPTGNSITIKEGQSCGDISVRGTITCSTVPGPGLDKTTCVMNKPTALYVSSLSACPT